MEAAVASVRFAEPILKAMAEPVLLLDNSLRAVFANPAFYAALKITLGALDGKSVHELIPGEHDQLPLESALERLVESNQPVEEFHLTRRRSPDRLQIFSINARQVFMHQDSPPLILIELRDITKEEEAAAQVQELHLALQRESASLRKINMELDSFTHSVSHDLRSPLRLINKIAYLLIHDHSIELSPQAVQKLKAIVGGTEEMGKLIEDLLVFSQVTHEPMKKKEFDLQRLVKEVVRQAKSKLNGKEVEVVIDDLGLCQADRHLLKQVFYLYENAIKFSRLCEQPRIHFGCMSSGAERVYFVRDNGIGFDMANSEAIFLVFQKFHKTHHFQGSGVGLALVKRIIERHDGQIWAESEPDRGAIFYFTLDATDRRRPIFDRRVQKQNSVR